MFTPPCFPPALLRLHFSVLCILPFHDGVVLRRSVHTFYILHLLFVDYHNYISPIYVFYLFVVTHMPELTDLCMKSVTLIKIKN